MAFPTGWQTTGQAELDAIYRQFRGGLAGPTARQTQSGPAGFPLNTIDGLIGNPTGAAGVVGSRGDTGPSSITPMEGMYMDSRYGKNVYNPDGSINPQLSLENRTGKKLGVPSGEIGTEGEVRSPSQNAMQKQQAAAEEPEGIRGISPQRRYFWATGRVDARATQSPRNAPTDFDATFGPNRQHMGGLPVTWQQRQAINQNAIADVRALRGLSPY